MRGYGLDHISGVESSDRSLNQGYGLGAHLRSSISAKVSVHSGSAYGNLENFHRTSISTNDFPPYIGDVFIPFRSYLPTHHKIGAK